MKDTKIIRNAARCKLCGDVPESKSRHDFNWCSCRAIFVDGGLVYLRRGGNLDVIEELSESIEIDICPECYFELNPRQPELELHDIDCSLKYLAGVRYTNTHRGNL